MKKFKSIKMRTIALIVPVLILILGIITSVSYLETKTTLEQQIKTRMNSTLDSVTKSIDNSLLAHSKIPELTARQIELSPSNYTLETYENMLRKEVPSNQDTFGAGVYFEPYKYKSDLQYFSIYVYRDGDTLQSTQAYSDPKYKYPSQDWYQMATSTDKKVVFSHPYYDPELDISMVTASAPFYNEQGDFLGVTTADIDLSQIQQMIQGVKVEKTGYAFLIDGNGTYIAAPEADKIMNTKVNDDPNPSLASLGNEIMEKSNGVLQFNDHKGDHTLFYQKIPNTDWTLSLVVPNDEMYASLSTILIKQSIVSMAGILLIIMVIMLFSSWIIRNLNKVNSMAKSIASGDLSHTLEVKTKDEFGQMATLMNQMQENLRGMINQIAVASETINGHSEELSQSSIEVKSGSEQVAVTMQELAVGSEKQADYVSNLVAIMDTFTREVKDTDQSGEQINASSYEVLKMTNEGKQLMESSSQQMMKIDEIVMNAVQRMDKLDNQTQEISKLIVVIKDIADQTNLLALNAAIEAARAGEHGKGFAVVADEVRKLAEQVASSIVDITGFITNIKSESRGVSLSLQEGYDEVEKGTVQINTTGETFNQISSSVSSMVNHIQSISENLSVIAVKCQEMNSSIEEIASFSEESAASVEETSAATQQINSSMEEVAGSSEQLTKLAEELNQIVRQFKI